MTHNKQAKQEITPNTAMIIIEWALGDDTGSSSKALCQFMLGIKKSRYQHPVDSGDRGRCIRLLNLIPEWWDRLDEMRKMPMQEYNVYRIGKITREHGGWKEQIPLIKKEGGKL